MGDVLVFGGGIIPEADIAPSRSRAWRAIFTPGTPDAGHRRLAGRGARRARGPAGQLTSPICRSAPIVRAADADIARAMDLFEYQGKQLLARFGVPISAGEAVESVDDAVAAADRLGYPVVVKAQVQVGGRGKAGGIKLADTTDEARLHASNILGMDIKGHVVRTVWIEKASDIAEEYYASFTLDRAAKKHLGMVSAKGGVDIEQVADEDPTAIARVHIDPLVGHRGLPRPPARLRRPAQPGRPQRRHRDPQAALPGLRRARRRPGRGQPADPHARRAGPRPRRQGLPRRQRRLPPPRVRGAAQPVVARPPGAGRPGAGPQLHRPRRRGRHHRQRRRAGDEHARRRQPGRRSGGQLPRRRRRRRRQDDRQRPRGDHRRPEGALGAHQHLRRHHPLRSGGPGHPRRLLHHRREGAGGRAARRNQRRGGPGHPGRQPEGRAGAGGDHAGSGRPGRGTGRARAGVRTTA